MKLFGTMRGRSAFVGLAAALLAVGAATIPALAAPQTISFTLSGSDTTYPTACPPSLPAGSFCGTGTGNLSGTFGTVTEQFASVVLFGVVDKNGCNPDSSVVTLTTSSGQIFVTTQGAFCQATGVDTEQFTITGGTGAFAGASGSGTIIANPTGPTAGGGLGATETYTGTITVR